ncbi:hypothetical protein L2Y94_11050 [Luteibacter aegosomatis]|uniref:hypothetical protein n=1 Tax=Luteibacter aegosomatis TaxID=2911537 RepID=UPI001FFC0E5F|nr:hypothetical protein [Luteibacter aegosomatis]UPG83895.1 hypothetical protein L2Y94_11050 [Luteibacter aegosomatis]
MLSFLKKSHAPLLSVRVKGREITRVEEAELPCEKNPAVEVEAGGMVQFIDRQGVVHEHPLGPVAGWYHFSVRVHGGLGCQVDCVVTSSSKFDPQAFARGEATGIRFQPFFLSGAKVNNAEFRGKGLFARGLHFTGHVTSGDIVLSCECDDCHTSFHVRSFHAGFSQVGYFYSDSGKHTLTVSDRVPGCPAALSTPNPTELAALEAALPLAPDGTRFRYTNPFRCPYCSAPYIDFEAHPECRAGEYYGNYFPGAQLLRYEPEP